MKKAYSVHLSITIAVMLFIFIQSALPGELSDAESNIVVQFIASITGWDEEVLHLFVRKAAHFTEFLILGICLSINMRDLRAKRIDAGEISPDAPVRRWCLAAWMIGTAYAVTDEFHQLFVPDRVCSLIDVCIDSAGVACGVFIYYMTSTLHIFRQIKTYLVPVKGRGTIGMYQNSIVVSLWIEAVSICIALLMCMLGSDNKWATFCQNTAIGIFCSAMLILVTTVIQFTNERNKIFAISCDNIELFVACLADSLSDKERLTKQQCEIKCKLKRNDK